MFKSIQGKIVTMFVLLIVSITVITGAFLLVNVITLYHNSFSSDMDKVFREELIQEIANTPQENADKIAELIFSKSGQLGISSNRFYYVLDAATGSVLKSSETTQVTVLEKTDNIIRAMAGNRGTELNKKESYMDYAVPLYANGTLSYIAYVRDNKADLNALVHRMIGILLQAVLLAAVIAVVLGFFLSRTISKPILSLTRRAERIATGKFDTSIVSESNSKDEIGRLSNTFKYMSSTLHDSIEEVKSEKTKVETILQNMTDGVLAFNLDGKLIHMNPEAQKILKLDDAQQLEFDTYFKSLDAKVSMGDLLYIEQDVPIERQIVIEERQYIRLNFATFKMDEKVAGIVVVIHDITKQEKLELSRREFVANVSHELRTPLTTIKTYAETLIDNPVDDYETQKHFLGVIEKEADRMTRIVKDLLTLSHLDHDTGFAADSVELKQLLSSITDNLSITAEASGLSLSYQATNETPPIKTNRDKLEQVIVNIVGNAIKYTPSGGTVEVYSGRIYNDVYIKVIDTGVGIPEENLPHVFERFYRVDKARSRDTGGTGLGLAIAKQIVDSLGGKINITSQYGKGTEVIISLPIRLGE